MLIIPASITIENGTITRKYRCTSKDKTNIYRIKTRRAVVRITASNFVKRLSEKSKDKKQVEIQFKKKNKEWCLTIKRSKLPDSTLQTYFGGHPYLQLVLNKSLPPEIWEESRISGKKSYTRHINVEFNPDEWNDILLMPYDFLPEVEKKAKDLMKVSSKYGFQVDFVPKGKAYDLELIGPSGRRFIMAISSHNAKTESRSKEKRKQKILMDIAKILPMIGNKNIHPVIISEPLSFKGSWSYTTDAYLDFYKQKFNFQFLTTSFKNGWEKDICSKLLELDNHGR